MAGVTSSSTSNPKTQKVTHYHNSHNYSGTLQKNPELRVVEHKKIMDRK